MRINKIYSLKKQAIYLVTGKIGAFIINFMIPIILVRLFTVEQYGQYRQVLLISLLFIPIIKFGIPNSLFYFYPIQKTRDELNELLSNFTYGLTLLVFVVLLLAYFVKDSLLKLLNIQASSNIIIYILLYIFFMVSSSIIEKIFIVEKKSKTLVIFFISDQIVRAFFLLFAVFYNHLFP